MLNFKDFAILGNFENLGDKYANIHYLSVCPLMSASVQLQSYAYILERIFNKFVFHDVDKKFYRPLWPPKCLGFRVRAGRSQFVIVCNPL